MKSSHALNSDHSSDKENVIECLKKYDLYSDANLNFIKLNSRDPHYFYYYFSSAIDILKSHQALNKENFEMIFKFPKDAEEVACSLTILSIAKITIDNEMRSLLKTIPQKSHAFSAICSYLKKMGMFEDGTIQQVYNNVVNMTLNGANTFATNVIHTDDLELRKKMLQDFLGDEKKKQIFSTNLMQDIWQANSKIKNNKMDEFKQRVFAINPDHQNISLNEFEADVFNYYLRTPTNAGEEILSRYQKAIAESEKAVKIMPEAAADVIKLKRLVSQLPEIMDSLIRKGCVSEIPKQRCTLD